MASTASLANAQSFTELWATFGNPHSTARERASSYQSLATCLKGDVTQDFVTTLSRQHKEVIQLVMDDITAGTCAQEAIQLLGYCLFTPQFAEACGDDAGKIIGVLCTVPYDKATERSVITRTLWCLSSQNFLPVQISHSVPQIITLATNVILEHGFSSLAVESLNVLLRINQQCPKEFVLVASMWYKGIVLLLQCKVTKFQRKAYSLAVSFESSIASNSYLVGYLTKELKERAISNLLGFMGERGKDPILILNIWTHFVTVLGPALHKHSSFLNEMLRVVELGFKHKVFLVQVAAYSSWKALINNFSIDMDLLTQQRRLKLLLMPLLASAVKDRHEQVETARLQTWWHLIMKLGPHKEPLFHQVCIPFLLFCLGVDPKLDLSKLPTILADVGSATPTKMIRVTQNKENVPTSDCPTGQAKSLSGQGHDSSHTGQLLALLSSLSTSPSGKKSNRYQSTPGLSLVISGCHAVLQFLGCDEKLCGSLLDTAHADCTVFLRAGVPLSVVQYLVAFLDGALLYIVHYSKEVKEGVVECLVKNLFQILLCSLKQETDVKAAACVARLLTDILKWEAVVSHVAAATRLSILTQFTSLPPAITTTICNTHGSLYWSGVAEELVQMAPSQCNNPIFLVCWKKLLEVSSTRATLTSFGDLCDLLDRFVELVVVDLPKKQQLQPIAMLCRMWNLLAQRMISFVKEMSQVNEGTALDPDFSSARHILKFPFFHHLFYNVEKPPANTAFETWKELYDIVNIHASLVVKDPNHCAELVCKDLYDSYGQNVRGDSATLDKGETINFDTYQNTVGLALTHVLTKFNWSPLKASEREESWGREGVLEVGQGWRGSAKSKREMSAKNLQSLVSLLSWQLATLWDTVQRSPMHIVNLTSPYTLMDTVALLYSNLPTPDLILTTTEMLAQPMVTLWQNVLESDQRPVVTNQKPLYRGFFDLPERIVKTWKGILTCFQRRYTNLFNSEILAVLCPLIVFALTSTRQELVNMTLSFWMATFDCVEEVLVYPNRLKDVFVRLKKSNLHLKLPGLETSGTASHTTLLEDGHSLPISDSVIVSNPPQSVTSTSDGSCVSTVVVPHPSPQKRVQGSFLGQKRSPKPNLPNTPPRSPAAQAMDEILARSHARQEGQASGNSTAKSPALSARRRLSLNTAKADDFVAVEPSAKRQQLLTEHQREKLRERSDSIPVMYNALDPSQDTSQYTASQPSSPDSEPIIIPESEGSPATAVDTGPIFRSCSSKKQIDPTSPISSITTSVIQGPSPLSPSTMCQSGQAVECAPTTTYYPTSSSVGSGVSTSSSGDSGTNVEGMKVQIHLGHGHLHVQKSPIASRTRSRLQPRSGGTACITHEQTSHPSHQFSYGPHAVQVIGRAAMPTAPPSLPVVPPASSRMSVSVSPTEQHYQSQHMQQLHPASSGAVASNQQMYQMHFSVDSMCTGRVLPIHPQVIPMNVVGQQVHNSSSQQQFVPLISPTSPIVNTPMQQATLSSPHQVSEPTFPPARYLIRPTSNPSPPPYSLHSPSHFNHSGQPLTKPLPLSAVVRPDLSGSRHSARSSFMQHTPSASGSPRPCLSATGGSVDSPIVIEDVEDPLARISDRQRSSDYSQNDTVGTKTVHIVEGVVCQAPAIRREASETVSSDGPVLSSAEMLTVYSKDQQEKDTDTDGDGKDVDMEVCNEMKDGECVSVTMPCESQPCIVSESRTDDSSTPPVVNKLLVDGPEVVSVEDSPECHPELKSMSVSCQPESDLMSESSQPASESMSDSCQPESEAMPELYQPESESLSESCQPGPCLLDPAVISAGSGEVDPSNNEPTSTTGLCIASVAVEDWESVVNDDISATADKDRGQLTREDVKNAESTEVSARHTECDEVNGSEVAHSTNNSNATEPTKEAEANLTKEAIGTEPTKDGDIDHATEPAEDVGISDTLEPTCDAKDPSKDADTRDITEDTSIDDTAVPTKAADTLKDSDVGDSKEPPKEADIVDAESVVVIAASVETPAEVSPVHATLKEMFAMQVTPTTNMEGNATSPRTTPGGILRHTSQFDTPTSMSGKVRRVQFASSPVVFQSSKEDDEALKTPKQSRSRTPLSSRRTLLKSDTNTRIIQTQKTPSTEPVFPSLTGCDSPVEDILPSLSPSRRFTHGLVHLVHARNIRTVGNISSLTEQEIQTLPIKPPKIENLKQALKNFQHQLEVTCVRQKADPKQIPKLLSHTEEAVLKESGAPHSATRTCDGELAEPTKHMTHMGLDEPILVPPEEPLLAQNTEDLEQSQVELERIDQQLDQPVMVTCINEGPQLEGVAPPQNDFSEPLKTGIKRRASEENDDLGPPTKLQRRDSSPSEEQESCDSHVSVEREEGESQLSLVSQSPQNEPAVQLSSPDDNISNANVADNARELLTDEVIDDDDVFMEDNPSTVVSEYDNVSISETCSHATVEYRVEDDTTIETRSALAQRVCNSPTVGMGSPEIPLQISPSKTEGPANSCGLDIVTNDQSIQDSDSSDGMGQEGEEVLDEQRQLQNNTEHDHPYISMNVDDGGQVRPVNVASTKLIDHSYCTVATSSRPNQAEGELPQNERSSDPEALRSKLSSGVQDHNYCRQQTPSTSQPLTNTEIEMVSVSDAAGDLLLNVQPETAAAESSSESQELFSISQHNADDDQSSAKLSPGRILRDVGCQTDDDTKPNVLLGDSGEYDTPKIPDAMADESVDSALKSVIDNVLARNDMNGSALLRVHRQLLRGLSLTSDRLGKILLSESS